MRKETALSGLGLVFLFFWFGNLLSIILVLEDVLGISEGSYLSRDDVLVLIYLYTIAMICGAIGGYLIGRYIHRALAGASQRTT